MFDLKIFLKSVFLAVFIFSGLVLPGTYRKQPTKESELFKTSFAQARGWPDIYWLKELHYSVESCLKQNIKQCKTRQMIPSCSDVSIEIEGLFNLKFQELEEIRSQLESSSFEFFCELTHETRGLGDWLSFLHDELLDLKAKVLGILEKHKCLAKDPNFWLEDPVKMQVEVRQAFKSIFSDSTKLWASDVPELICAQTNPDHNYVMDRNDSFRAIDLTTFLRFELPRLSKQLNALLVDDFRQELAHSSIKARFDFYAVARRTSELVRYFDCSQFMGISNEDYKAVFNHIETIAKTVISRYMQLQYDKEDFNKNIKTSIWILMYWFYNIFPYKDLPWEDENYLVIESLFRQVSALLNLNHPHVFLFNSNRRNRFRNERKSH